MRKGLAKDQRRPLKIVVATGTNRGVKGVSGFPIFSLDASFLVLVFSVADFLPSSSLPQRPKGVKGRYKMLDSEWFLSFSPTLSRRLLPPSVFRPLTPSLQSFIPQVETGRSSEPRRDERRLESPTEEGRRSSEEFRPGSLPRLVFVSAFASSLCLFVRFICSQRISPSLYLRYLLHYSLPFPFLSFFLVRLSVQLCFSIHVSLLSLLSFLDDDESRRREGLSLWKSCRLVEAKSW